METRTKHFVRPHPTSTMLIGINVRVSANLWRSAIRVLRTWWDLLAWWFSSRTGLHPYSHGETREAYTVFRVLAAPFQVISHKTVRMFAHMPSILHIAYACTIVSFNSSFNLFMIRVWHSQLQLATIACFNMESFCNRQKTL